MLGQEGGRTCYNTLMIEKVIITSYSDPVCTWCWGSEPVYRALETHFPGEIEFRYVMGGLVKDINDFADPKNGIGGGIEQANRQITAHWKEAERMHGMPAEDRNFDLFDEEHPSSYAQGIAFKAAELVDKNLAKVYLRRLRQATEAEGLKTNRQDVLVSLASEVGLDVGQFITHLTDGSAEKAFRGDLQLTQYNGVTGFPTAEVKYRDSSYMLRGYNDYDTFLQVIKLATGGSVKPSPAPATEENVEILLAIHPTLAREELRQALDWSSNDELDQMMDELEEAGKIKREPAGLSWFASEVDSSTYCDVETGICR